MDPPPSLRRKKGQETGRQGCQGLEVPTWKDGQPGLESRTRGCGGPVGARPWRGVLGQNTASSSPPFFPLCIQAGLLTCLDRWDADKGMRGKSWSPGLRRPPGLHIPLSEHCAGTAAARGSPRQRRGPKRPDVPATQPSAASAQSQPRAAMGASPGDTSLKTEEK